MQLHVFRPAANSQLLSHNPAEPILEWKLNVQLQVIVPAEVNRGGTDAASAKTRNSNTATKQYEISLETQELQVHAEVRAHCCKSKTEHRVLCFPTTSSHLCKRQPNASYDRCIHAEHGT
jgi:hypothetical protein